jgi:hypothetical protein
VRECLTSAAAEETGNSLFFDTLLAAEADAVSGDNQNSSSSLGFTNSKNTMITTTTTNPLKGRSVQENNNYKQKAFTVELADETNLMRCQTACNNSCTD